MRTKLDIALVREGQLNLQGWAFGRDPETRVSYRVTDGQGKDCEDAVIEAVPRDRVAEAYFSERIAAGHPVGRALGFNINVPYVHGQDETRILVIEVDGRRRQYRINDRILESFNSRAHQKREKLLSLLRPETFGAAWEVLRKKGFRALLQKSFHRLKNIREEYEYNDWRKLVRTTEEELQRQREETKKLSAPVLFSVVIPVYRTPEKFLRRMLDSLAVQSYPYFELNAADASEYEKLPWDASDGKKPCEVLEEYRRRDPRFRYTVLRENLGISENTNEAVRRVSPEADFVVFCDHDDELSPDALYECYREIQAYPEAELLYSDEDKIDFESAFYFEPHFKSDYNPDLLRSVNYICHLLLLKKTLLEEISERDEKGNVIYERPAFDGAQDYDLILRACETAERHEREADREEAALAYSRISRGYQEERLRFEAAFAVQQPERAASPMQCSGEGKEEENPAKAEEGAGKTESESEGRMSSLERGMRDGLYLSRYIRHIRKVLYHWRSHPLSTAANPESKLYAFTAGGRAVQAQLRRLNLPCERVERGITYGFYHPIYEIRKENGAEPLVSVIIPNKDHIRDLDLAIRSLLSGSYRNVEIIVVENNSVEPETAAYYEKIQQEFPEGQTVSVRVITWKSEFNYSLINNFGVRYAKGDYLLFMNNDIELLGRESLREMMMYAQRPEVGAVGARLLYPDGQIQHGGVVLGFGGIAGACFIGIHDSENSYMHRAKCIQDYSAVTAACMLSRREVFDAVGGFTGELKVAFNDIDFCMKLRSLGYLVVYNPYALFHHYESKSRGLEDTPEKVERFNREIVCFAKRWREILRQGDPYYHPALTLRKSNFSLRDLKQEEIGKPYGLPILKDIV